MRLLHFDNVGKLISTEFHGEPIPPYAILSHRWGDGEVLFEDLVKDNYRTKTGYQKIEFCAKQAAQDHLHYFWVDTCCIDKWNLHELSEAINSMFLWYRNATKCYVFLADVSVPTATDAHQHRTWEALFVASKWFTRGWTLQELIAPRSVEFFSLEGRRIGDRNTLEKLIHEITYIPMAALRGCPLEDFSVSERIEWAKTRETTEPEDNVYCLLGILNVQMTISYNERKESALRRLRQELETTDAAPCNIPFLQNLQFIGREAQLATLEASLFQHKQTTMVAITGVGGTGKSQLALELAYRTKEKRSGCSVFWVDAGNVDSLHQAYLTIAQKLDIRGWNDQNVDIKRIVTLYLSAEITRQWLLIFDNVDEVTLGSTGLSSPQSANLLDYLPQSHLGSIVFTTNNGDTAKALASHNVVELQAMTLDNAQRIFENYVTTDSPSEKEETKLLLKELSYLPLAIVQAANYIQVERTTLQDYRSLLVAQKEQAIELTSSDTSEDNIQERNLQTTVTTTLLVSLDRIIQIHGRAADRLFLAACVDRKDVPLEYLEAASSSEKKIDTIGILKSYGLVTRRPADSAIDVHRLVHLAIREWLRKRKRLDGYIQRAIKHLFIAFPDKLHENRSKWRRLLPHVQCALSHRRDEREQDDDGSRKKLMYNCALVLLEDGRYTESERLIAQVIEELKTKLSADDPTILSQMIGLALTYRYQGRLEEAEQLQVRVIEMSELRHGADHPRTLSMLGNLAQTYMDQGQWDKAERLQTQLMETRKTKLGLDLRDMPLDMSDLATTYRQQGRLTEAEQLQTQVTDTLRTNLGINHPDTLVAMDQLAAIYIEQDRFNEAEKLQVHAMEATRKNLGTDHPVTLMSMNNLALTYTSQDRWEEAAQLQEQVMDMSKTTLGVDHPHRLRVMDTLAFTWKKLGRTTEAIQLMEDCAQRRARVLGATHPDTLASRADLIEWEAELS